MRKQRNGRKKKKNSQRSNKYSARRSSMGPLLAVNCMSMEKYLHGRDKVSAMDIFRQVMGITKRGDR